MHGISASGLRGFPFTIFEQMLFININPKETLRERADLLYSLFAMLKAKNKNERDKEWISRVECKFGNLLGDFHVLEKSAFIAPHEDAEGRAILYEIQSELYQVIADKGIIDAVVMGEEHPPPE